MAEPEAELTTSRTWYAGLISWLALGAILLTSGCAAPELEPPDRELLGSYWQEYLKDDPAWPDHREEWIQAGPASQALLLELLFVELLSSHKAGVRRGEAGVEARRRVARARGELAYQRFAAIPYLMEALAVATKRDQVDWVSVECIGQSLAQLHAAEEVEKFWKNSEREGARSAAVQSLVEMEWEESWSALTQVLAQDEQWRNRALAIRGLRPAAPSVEEVQAGLVAALEDPDEYVQDRAAEALAEARTDLVQDGLIEFYARLYEAGELGRAARMYEILRSNTKQMMMPSDPAAWREWASKRADS